jgi:DMSO reductase anchor subunit
MTAAATRAPTWKRALAVILDLFTVFIGGGLLIGWLTGDTTPGGFNLTGVPALILFALFVAYFFFGRRYAGGTLWDRILGIRRPQPS